VLGAFADGLHGDLGLLAVKSLLDGFAMQQVMTPAVVAAMTAVGGLLLIAIGLRTVVQRS
jgi:uncharacterized membrane protein YqgA involved in biofilm formation